VASESDLIAWEQFCREQAALCVLDDSRRALEKLALDYRAAADLEERVALTAPRRDAPICRA